MQFFIKMLHGGAGGGSVFFTRPVGGGAAGGSLRSSRQAAA